MSAGPYDPLRVLGTLVDHDVEFTVIAALRAVATDDDRAAARHPRRSSSSEASTAAGTWSPKKGQPTANRSHTKVP